MPAAIAAVGAVEVAIVRPDGWGYAVLLETTAALLLVWRRTWPLIVSTTAAAVLLVVPWLGPQFDQLSAPILTIALMACEAACGRAYKAILDSVKAGRYSSMRGAGRVR